MSCCHQYVINTLSLLQHTSEFEYLPSSNVMKKNWRFHTMVMAISVWITIVFIFIFRDAQIHSMGPCGDAEASTAEKWALEAGPTFQNRILRYQTYSSSSSATSMEFSLESSPIAKGWITDRHLLIGPASFESPWGSWSMNVWVAYEWGVEW